MRYFLIFFVTALTAACGVKPGAVDAPSGRDQDSFPRTYPDLATDPDANAQSSLCLPCESRNLGRYAHLKVPAFAGKTQEGVL